MAFPKLRPERAVKTIWALALMAALSGCYVGPGYGPAYYGGYNYGYYGPYYRKPPAKAVLRGDVMSVLLRS